MDSKTFDGIAKSLNNSFSRRRAMQGVLGGAVLAAVAPSLVPRPAEAGSRAKKRCRNKGGVYMEKGTCHCTSTGCNLTCHGNPDCHCYETTEGRGFCAGYGHTKDCTTTADCQSGEVCAKTCIGLVCVPPCPS
jgi:hypothetical protein